MSRFTGPLAVTFLSARTGLATLDQDLVWEVGEEGSGVEVRVPRGFVSDGASVPRLLWWILAPWGSRATRPAILHDFALSRLKAGVPLPELPDRRRIDAEFRKANVACGFSEKVAAALWLFVRAWSLTAPLRASLNGS